MLKGLRKHASGWLIKVALGLIVLSFALFFGYTKFQQSVFQSENLLARVGEISIPRRKFDLLREESEKRFRESLKDAWSEKLGEILESNLKRQLIDQEVAAVFARSLGIRVTDEEVAGEIRKDPNFLKDGAFDYVAYAEGFRPNYKRIYGEDFEDAVRGDLMRQRLLQLSGLLYGPWEAELQNYWNKAMPPGAMPPKPEKKRSKKKAKQTDEGGKVPPSISSQRLLSQWIESFRDTIKIEIY